MPSEPDAAWSRRCAHPPHHVDLSVVWNTHTDHFVFCVGVPCSALLSKTVWFLYAENPLIRGLKDLHESIIVARDLDHVDTCAYLSPFLDVIVCEDIDATVTRITLQSVHKFLAYGYIHKESPNVEAAMDLVRQPREEAGLVRMIDALLCLLCLFVRRRDPFALLSSRLILNYVRDRLCGALRAACPACWARRRTATRATAARARAPAGTTTTTAAASGPWRTRSRGSR